MPLLPGINTQFDVSLSPDGNGDILLADNIVRIDIEYRTRGTGSTSLSDTRDITQRGGKLFNRTDNTYTFTKAVEAMVVYLLDWDDLPEPARRFITVRSARIFQDRMVGSEAHHGFSQEDEVRARALLREFEMDTGDHSIFDNYDVYNIVARPLVNRASII